LNKALQKKIQIKKKKAFRRKKNHFEILAVRLPVQISVTAATWDGVFHFPYCQGSATYILAGHVRAAFKD
jgi:hypothetical protein